MQLPKSTTPPKTPSSFETLSLPSQPVEVIEAFAKAANEAPDDDVKKERYNWYRWARVEQRAPEGDWRYWLILAGRGFGKDPRRREWVRAQAAAGRRRIALVAPRSLTSAT